MNKGVKHFLILDAEADTASINFNGPTLKNNGAWVIHPRPALQIVNNESCLVTTIARGVVVYGPTDASRACDDLIHEAAFLIFGDDLDAGTAAVCVADCECSAIRCNHRIDELVRTPIVLVRR